MRQTTRRKWYGRISIAQAINSALNDLDKALEESKKSMPSPLSQALAQAGKSLTDAAKACETYGMDRKRLVTALQRERDHIAAMLEEVKAIPVLPEEKAIAKHKTRTKMHAK